MAASRDDIRTLGTALSAGLRLPSSGWGHVFTRVSASSREDTQLTPSPYCCSLVHGVYMKDRSRWVQGKQGYSKQMFFDGNCEPAKGKGWPWDVKARTCCESCQHRGPVSTCFLAPWALPYRLLLSSILANSDICSRVHLVNLNVKILALHCNQEVFVTQWQSSLKQKVSETSLAFNQVVGERLSPVPFKHAAATTGLRWASDWSAQIIFFCHCQKRADGKDAVGKIKYDCSRLSSPWWIPSCSHLLACRRVQPSLD